MRKLLTLALLLCPLIVRGQVAISSNTPTYGWNVLPGSVRHINVNITGGATNHVNWSVLSTTGGASATLSATTNTYPWVDVTAGATGGTCSITGTGPYTVSSSAGFIIQAQAFDDGSKTTNFVFNVCSASVSVEIVPFYRSLYSGQLALLQSYVTGSTNLGVTWSITAQPGGGDGSLSDTAQRDTVFSATVAGRYTVKATSTADGSKTATATMYVTGHTLPYNLTPNKTTPVDCTVDSAASGATYEVGPSQFYPNLTAVPTTSIGAGATIRVHNEDVTGTNPTTYHEYVQLQGIGTRTQPIRICGVPDASGNLPVIDESNATGRSDTSAFAAGYGGISVHHSGIFALYPTYNGDQYIVIEGLKIKNTGAGNSYYPPGSGTLTPWIVGASCIRLAQVWGAVIVGNDLSNCGNGTFSDFNANNMWGGFNGYTLWEGNWLHDNGNAGSATEHQLYIQGWYQVAQFNRIDGYKAGGQGSNLKSRGIGDIIRYNYLGEGPLRQLDLVEDQDAGVYHTFEQYLAAGGRPTYPTDAYTAFQLTAIQELWHHTFVYGNIIENTTSGWLVHFKGDHGSSGFENRTGVLSLYNNTLQTSQGILDNDDNGGGSPVEFPTAAIRNNIIWIPTLSFGTCWNRSNIITSDFKTNLISGVLNNITTPINGSACNTLTTPWVNTAGNFASFPLAVPLDTHLTGITAGNFLTDTVQPYSSGSFVPLAGHTQAGTPLTGDSAIMPVRFQFQPNLYPKLRPTPVTSVTGGTVGAIDYVAPTLVSIGVSPSTATIATGTTQQFTATCTYSDASTTNCTATVTWSSSGAAASISATGLASGISAGTVTITASTSGISGTATLNVYAPPGTSLTGFTFKGLVVHN